MKRKLLPSEYPKGELLRIQCELDQISVPRNPKIGFNPFLPDDESVADRVTWLIRQVKRLQQSRIDLKKKIDKLN